MSALGPPLASLLLKQAARKAAASVPAPLRAKVAATLYKLAWGKACARAKTRGRLRLKKSAHVCATLAKLGGSPALAKVASDLDAGLPIALAVARRCHRLKMAHQLKLIGILAKIAWEGEDQGEDEEQQGRARFTGGRDDGLSFMRRTIGF